MYSEIFKKKTKYYQKYGILFLHNFKFEIVFIYLHLLKHKNHIFYRCYYTQML